MGASKDLNYSPEELLLAQICKAISHPARAKMLLHLLNKGSFRNIDFSRSNQLSVSTTHSHVYKLKEADLVHLEYATNEYHVTLKPNNIDLLQQLLEVVE